MTRFFLLALLAASLSPAQQKPAETPPPAAAPAVVPPADDLGPEAIVQKLFDSMAARDALAAKDLFVPDADLFSLGAKGQASRMPLIDFLKVLGSGKAEWRERIWNATVLVHGPIAVVWAPYDFHLKGDFTHCGYDSISLLKTAAGWKITYISDTRETEGCVNPLGPPTR
jgi:putative lumazine-binding protein